MATLPMLVTMFSDNGAPVETEMQYHLDALVSMCADCVRAKRNGVEMWYTCVPLWEPEILRVTYKITAEWNSVAAMTQHISVPGQGVSAF